jgi:1-acyl-sn-glycerol-3-phosphate acyltransferase
MSDIRERKLASSSTPPAHAIKVGEDRRPNSGLLVQILRTLLLAIWFWTCIFCIFVIQLIGCPLYFIRKDYYYAYMALTKKSFGILIITITQWGAPTRIRVSGDKSIRGELHQTKDGHLKTMFPDRLVLIANHQVYTDWLYLWWIAYSARMHGHLFIILKETLKYIPILGQGMMFYGFIFMARKWQSDKPRLEHRLRKLKTQHSRHLSGSQPFDPMWLMIFPEGTNLSANSKEKNDEYCQKQGIPIHRHLLLPRSTGLYFCLQQLRETVDYVYDCTLAYEGPP